MKKEIYITILLFAFMLFALITTVVRGKSFSAKESGQYSPANDHNTLITKLSSDMTLSMLTGVHGLNKAGSNEWVNGSI